MCSAKRHVRFTPNSDIDCVFRTVWFGPEADIGLIIQPLVLCERKQASIRFEREGGDQQKSPTSYCKL
jgi:hypothetical protein